MPEPPDPKFPLGKPIRPEPPKPVPKREQVKKGIFRVDGKLETDIPANGPRTPP